MACPSFCPTAFTVLLGLHAITSYANGAVALASDEENRLGGVRVTVAPMTMVRERSGITGAGWGAAYEVLDGAQPRRQVTNIYPNHPDDWGKTAGTGASHSLDGGETWTPDPDNSPISGMVDLWQDQLRDGTLMALGIKLLPDRSKLPAVGADGLYHGTYSYGISSDQGRTWRFAATDAYSSTAIGPIARPLPRIVQEPDGSLLMPAYAWNKQGNVALLLKSRDLGKTWQVASTIATATAIRAAGVQVTMPWFENMVARVADGSLLAVIRTSSNARGAIVAARSTDHGATWSSPEKILAGPQQRPVAGKLPNLCLLPNGVLVLLTAHTRDHCRIYLSLDGTGRQWTDGFIITSQSGGNTSMVSVDYDKLLIFTPATGRIACWEVTITPRGLQRIDLRSGHAAGRVAIKTDLLARSETNPATGIVGPLDGSTNYSNAAMSGTNQARGSYTIEFDHSQNLKAIALALKSGEPESAEVLLSQDGRRWEKSGVALDQWVSHTSRRTAFMPGTSARFVKIELSAPRGPVVLGEVALYAEEKSGRVPAPENVTVAPEGESLFVSWSAPPGVRNIARYLITPILIKPPQGDQDMQIYAHAPIKTRQAVNRLELGKTLARGATYRFEVAAVDAEGRISAAASSAEIVMGPTSAKAVLP